MHTHIRYLLATTAACWLLSACSEDGDGARSTDTETVEPGGTAADSDTATESDTAADSATEADSATTFYVSGRHLYDPCGEQVVLRGVNEMVIWSPGKDGVPEFENIAKTGANAVRIVWTSDGTADQLRTAIENALAQQLIPIVENHDATGDLSLVPSVVDYWTQPDVVAVLRDHQDTVLLNIANEAGDNSVGDDDFRTTYQQAIDALRQAGLAMPLIIDAPQWGQDIDTLQALGPDLIDYDPLHNLLFSVHMWWYDPAGDRVIAEIAESVAMELPLIVGEFAQHAVYLCDQAPFAYKELLAQAQANQIGWLVWSWGGVQNNDCKDAGPFDMTEGGVFGQWTAPWAEEVAVTDPNSIQNTSVRPGYITTGSCQ